MPRLANRHHLLALLTHLVACRAVNQIKHEAVQKRGGGRVRGSSAVDRVADAGRTPLEEALLADCYRHYLERLPEHLRDIAELYLAGCTHREIAGRKDCAERTVDRKIALILKKWQEMAASLAEEPSAAAEAAGLSAFVSAGC